MGLMIVQRRSCSLEPALRDLDRRFDPRALVGDLAQVAPEPVTGAQRRRGEETARYRHLDLERARVGDCGGELVDKCLGLITAPGLERAPSTLAERTPQRLRISDLAGANQEYARVLVCLGHRTARG